MRVVVLHFAVVRERTGKDREDLELPDDARVSHALAALCDRHPSLTPLLPRVRVAVNQRFADAAQSLADGDEVALIPPVAGGSAGRTSGASDATVAGAPPPAVALLDTPLSLDAVLRAVGGPGHGGVVTFTGVVRDHGQRAGVVRLEYEAFGPMALTVIQELVAEIQAEWPGVRVAVHHRTGALMVGDAAVVVAASAPHRAEAFAACRAAIDRLKERAPIWKKEIFGDGAIWVGLGP